MHMMNEILLSIVSVCLIALTVTFVIALISTNKKMEKIQKDIHHLSLEGIKLMQHCDELSQDLQKKSESVHFIFHFLEQVNRQMKKKQSQDEGVVLAEDVSGIFDLIGKSINLCNKISGDIKKYVKS